MNQYDSTLFKGTAQYYARYRRPYPKAIFKLLVDKFALDGTGRLLDLGSGTGRLAMPLSQYFEEVVAVEPDPEMVHEGKQQAEKAGITNIMWIQKTAEGFTDQPQSFRLVTFGTALHWMNKDAVLKKVYSLLIPNGGLAVIEGGKTLWRSERQWQKEILKVVQKYLGKERRAGKGTFQKDERPYEDVIAQAHFSNIQHHEVTESEKLSIDFIIGNLYSTSFASKELLGEKAQAFEQELQTALLKLSPGGKFSERRKVQAILAWKLQFNLAQNLI